ncbi:MAG TPA: hypothetical protein VIL46_18990 [Gemmataceae bacterium]
MNPTPPKHLETDPRFPSGPWTGFFLQKEIPGKHQMELHLTFVGGTMTGEGRDWVGNFILRGRYDLSDGSCYWTKSYIDKHDVFYRGFNEGKGIWGTWELDSEGYHYSGGFHIWPVEMGDPSRPALREQADVPVEQTDEILEPV